MKRILIISVSLFFSLTLCAQSIALCRDGETQIFNGNTAFAQAYEATLSGDTLYFSGGTFFPPTTLNKELTLFGAGHYQDSTLVTGKTIISGDLNLVTGANNFYIEGFQISGRIQVGNNNTISGLTCKRNYITQTINFLGNQDKLCSNIAVIGSVFSGGNFENAESVLVSNSIISNGYFSNSHGNSFNNNIILFHYYSSSTHVFRNSNNNLISNNIIHRSDTYSSYIANGDGNVFNNNIFSHSAPNLGSNSSKLNNQFEVDLDDLFVNQTGVDFN